jgi:hypothetical protein
MREYDKVCRNASRRLNGPYFRGLIPSSNNTVRRDMRLRIRRLRIAVHTCQGAAIHTAQSTSPSDFRDVQAHGSLADGQNLRSQLSKPPMLRRLYDWCVDAARGQSALGTSRPSARLPRSPAACSAISSAPCCMTRTARGPFIFTAMATRWRRSAPPTRNMEASSFCSRGSRRSLIRS